MSHVLNKCQASLFTFRGNRVFPCVLIPSCLSYFRRATATAEELVLQIYNKNIKIGALGNIALHEICIETELVKFKFWFTLSLTNILPQLTRWPRITWAQLQMPNQNIRLQNCTKLFRFQDWRLIKVVEVRGCLSGDKNIGHPLRIF